MKEGLTRGCGVQFVFIIIIIVWFFFTDGDFNCTLCYGRKSVEWNDKCEVWW